LLGGPSRNRYPALIGFQPLKDPEKLNVIISHENLSFAWQCISIKIKVIERLDVCNRFAWKTTAGWQIADDSH
jgi:hypothetical protein